MSSVYPSARAIPPGREPWEGSTRLLSATDVAIAVALEAGTLRVVERIGRFGDSFFAIEDDRGLIEVHLTRDELDARINAIKAALA